MSDQNNLYKTGDQSNGLAGNVWKFYAYRGFFGFGKGLLIPIIVLFFLDRGITLLAFTLFWALLNVSTVIFEIPTGIVADRFSRKWSVCAGALFEVAAILIVLSTTNYLPLALGFISWGIGQALQSGAASALLYDSQKAEGLEAEFHRTIGTATSVNLIATVLGAALSGILVGVGGLLWPWLIAGGAHLLGGIVAALFREPPFLEEARSEQKNASLRAHLLGYVTHLKASLQVVGQDSGLIALIFISMVSARLFILVERPFAQPFLTAFGYIPAQISYFHTIFFIITAIFAKNSHKVSRLAGSSERYAILSVGLFGVVSLSIMVNAWVGPVVMVGLIGIYLMKGLFTPLLETSLNRRVTSAQRACCLSIASMGNNFLGVFLGPMFGYFADEFSLRSSLLIFQWMFGPLLLIGAIWVWYALGRIYEPTPV